MVAGGRRLALVMMIASSARGVCSVGNRKATVILPKLLGMTLSRQRKFSFVSFEGLAVLMWF